MSGNRLREAAQALSRKVDVFLDANIARAYPFEQEAAELREALADDERGGREGLDRLDALIAQYEAADLPESGPEWMTLQSLREDRARLAAEQPASHAAERERAPRHSFAKDEPDMARFYGLDAAERGEPRP